MVYIRTRIKELIIEQPSITVDELMHELYRKHPHVTRLAVLTHTGRFPTVVEITAQAWFSN
jgi:hypothetical protein